MPYSEFHETSESVISFLNDCEKQVESNNICFFRFTAAEMFENIYPVFSMRSRPIELKLSG